MPVPVKILGGVMVFSFLARGEGADNNDPLLSIKHNRPLHNG